MKKIAVRAHWDSTGRYSLRAVGTSYYCDQIEAVAQNTDGKSALTFCTAELVPEANNEADVNAIAVHIHGKKVAHLSREFASKFRGFLKQLPSELQITTVEAVILNGLRTEDKAYEYSIELDFPDTLKISTEPVRDINEIIRINGYPPIELQPNGTYSVKVWVPTSNLNDLDKNKTVETWSTEKWNTVNFYALNRQRLGLGFKIYELKKQEYIRFFGETDPECLLEIGDTRIALLRITPTSSNCSSAGDGSQ